MKFKNISLRLQKFVCYTILVANQLLLKTNAIEEIRFANLRGGGPATVTQKISVSDGNGVKNEISFLQQQSNDLIIPERRDWTNVTRSDWDSLVLKAEEEVNPIISTVDTDCELYILPSNVQGNNPEIKFQCGEDRTQFRDGPCNQANICRVVLNNPTWKSVLDTNSSPYSSGNDFIHDVTKNSNNDKSPIFMMVDTVQYLVRKKLFESFLNKASYSLISGRDLYIWIGSLDDGLMDSRDNIPRTREALDKQYCTPEGTEPHNNKAQYLKPIAFLTLFKKVLPSTSSSSVFFMDADADLTIDAFELISREVSPESYLELSPQASIMFAGNVRGEIMANTGLMVMRNTKWARDAISLWWYARCDYNDQFAFWLVLFSTFSAWTSHTKAITARSAEQFTFPGSIFNGYRSAFRETLFFFRKHGHKIQSSWKEIIDMELTPEQNNINDEYALPRPTNTLLYNGNNDMGKGIKDVHQWGIKGKPAPPFEAPIELPHVMILPQGDFQFEHHHQGMTTRTVYLPRIKSDGTEHSFAAHSKELHSCTENRCWPYLILQ